MKLIKCDSLEVTVNPFNLTTIIIDNLNIYSTNCLINYVNPLDIFDLNNCLKIFHYNIEIFIKKNWNKSSDYVCDILCLSTLKSVLSKTFKFELIILNNREYLLQILNEIRFFSFATKFTAEIKK